MDCNEAGAEPGLKKKGGGGRNFLQKGGGGGNHLLGSNLISNKQNLLIEKRGGRSPDPLDLPL